jgi:transcriptional regulator with XRE-family HTH domain
MMNDYKDVLKRIGANKRAERARKGYSQEKFAEIASVHTNYIGKIERGEQNLTVKKLVEISNALGVSFERIFLDK